MKEDIVLQSHDVYQLNLALTSIVDAGQCDIAMLINKSGRLIASQNETSAYDKTSIAALVSGTFASNGAIAQLIGESEFETLYQEGKTHHLYVAQLDLNNILCLIFTARSNLKRIKMVISDNRTRITDVLKNLYQTVSSDPFLNLDVSTYQD